MARLHRIVAKDVKFRQHRLSLGNPLHILVQALEEVNIGVRNVEREYIHFTIYPHWTFLTKNFSLHCFVFITGAAAFAIMNLKKIHFTVPLVLDGSW